MKTFLLSSISLLVGLSLTSGVWAATAGKLLPPTNGEIYHGVFPDFPDMAGEVTIKQRIDEFEFQSGKDVVWTVVGNHWLDGIYFPGRQVDAIQKADKIPLIHLMPWSEILRSYGADPVYSFDRILSGAYDWEIRRYAQNARNTGSPVMLDIMPEPNGNWYPWSGYFNGADTTWRYGNQNVADGPEKYVDVYRHIVDLFKAEQADNVTFVFHVVSDNMPNAEWNSMAAYYPGDNYVDWIGVSVYSAQSANDYWEDFSESMDNAYPELAAISLNKPLAVLEFGIVEDPGRFSRKADWIIDAFATIKANRYPRIAGISYWHESAFNFERTNNMRIDSSQAALRAYQDEVADAVFTGVPVLATRGGGEIGDDKCSCGLFATRYGETCGVRRPETQIAEGRSEFLVESSGTFSCNTEAQCLSNYGEYLLDTNFWCPNGWEFSN
jgi:hypothetical protein